MCHFLWMFLVLSIYLQLQPLDYDVICCAFLCDYLAWAFFPFWTYGFITFIRLGKTAFFPKWAPNYLYVTLISPWVLVMALKIFAFIAACGIL